MIEKSRLEELIEQGATIYSTHWQEEVDLSLPCEFQYDGGGIEYLIIHEDENHSPSYRLEGLTEDIEGAKWEEEFGCIEKTERLELPTWKEIKQNLWGDGIKFTSKNSIYVLRFDVPVEYIPSIPSSIAIRLIDITNKKELICIDFTKENYTLACRKAKELFLGQSNDN